MNNFTTKLMTFAFGIAVSLDQALAMGWLLPSNPGSGGGATAAPELDGPGGIAAIAVIVSVALVLYNRSKNR